MGFGVYFKSTLTEFADKMGVAVGEEESNDIKIFNLSNQKAQSAIYQRSRLEKKQV